MKSFLAATSVVAFAAGSAMANVSVSEVASLVSNPGGQSTQGSGDEFLVAPGIGGAGGFALAATGLTTTFMGTTGPIGTGLDASAPTIISESSMTDNGGGNFDIRVFIFTDNGADMFPGGFSVGGLPADTAGFFMGASAGGDPIDFADVAITNSATIEIFDAAGPAGGPFDISGFGNFTALGGGWDGSLGVSFGAGSAAAGVNAVELLVNVTVVPAPSALAMIGLGGLVAGRRRR